MLNLFSVVVFYRSMVNWRMGALIDVHSAICYTVLVYWYARDLWSLAGGGRSEFSWCSGIPQFYDCFGVGHLRIHLV